MKTKSSYGEQSVDIDMQSHSLQCRAHIAHANQTHLCDGVSMTATDNVRKLASSAPSNTVLLTVYGRLVQQAMWTSKYHV